MSTFGADGPGSATARAVTHARGTAAGDPGSRRGALGEVNAAAWPSALPCGRTADASTCRPSYTRTASAATTRIWKNRLSVLIPKIDCPCPRQSRELSATRGCDVKPRIQPTKEIGGKIGFRRPGNAWGTPRTYTMSRCAWTYRLHIRDPVEPRSVDELATTLTRARCAGRASGVVSSDASKTD